MSVVNIIDRSALAFSEKIQLPISILLPKLDQVLQVTSINNHFIGPMICYRNTQLPQFLIMFCEV